MTKNDSEAVVNVNLARCVCAHGVLGGPHADGCPGAPVLVPLPLGPWRSVTMTVRLAQKCPTHPHDAGTCEPMQDEPARCVYGEHQIPSPIRVSCSIGGPTWAGSEVVDVDPPADGYPSMLRACRDRWALVKALVTGNTEIQWYGPTTRPIFEQRDTVFAAITEMVRYENAAALAQERALRAMDALWIDYGGCPGHHSIMDGRRPSVVLLARYVEEMIEEVGHHVQ